MSDNAPAKTLEDALRIVLQDPSVIEKLVLTKNAKRPPHTSKLSNFSYYRRIYALDIKVTFDEMIEDKQDREWKYSSFPDLKPSSVYMRVYQGLRYLINEMDTDGKYANYRDMVCLTKEKTGIRLTWNRDKLEGRVFAASKVSNADKINEWKVEIEQFLEDHTREILHLKNLSLTNEQIEELQISFVNIEGIYPLITEREIKIVKDKSLVVSEDEASKLKEDV